MSSKTHQKYVARPRTCLTLFGIHAREFLFKAGATGSSLSYFSTSNSNLSFRRQLLTSNVSYDLTFSISNLKQIICLKNVLRDLVVFLDKWWFVILSFFLTGSVRFYSPHNVSIILFQLKTCQTIQKRNTQHNNIQHRYVD